MAPSRASGAEAAPPRPRRSEHGAARRRPAGARALLLFLAFGLAPVAFGGWFLLQPEAVRSEWLARLPEGWGRRGLQALACLGLLVALARVALPAFHGASRALRAGLAWLRARPVAWRALLFPAEALVWMLWFAAQIAFALDAALIVVSAAAFLLLVASIFKPELIPSALSGYLG